MDLKPLDLVWVDEISTSWSHPGDLPEFSDIPGLAIASDVKPEKNRPLLSQVYLPSHRLPPSEFDPPPTLALYAGDLEGIHDKSIALQLSLFPSAIYCHIPGGDKHWRAALQMEREVFMQNTLAKSVMSENPQATCRKELPLRSEGTTRKAKSSSSKQVICEFRRTAGLIPQLSRYMKPAGRSIIIRFVQEEDLERPRR